MFREIAKVSAAIIAALFITLAVSNHRLVPAQEGTEVKPSDTTAYYKAKCAMCHGANAEKKFDAAMAEDQMLEAVLKGKKVEKPPHMPAYEAKGVSADDAKALIAHMKKLKETPAN